MDYKEINDYLVGIFNNVLIIEEASLKTSRFKDVSIKEMHTIDEIGNRENATPSDIAKALMVTLGTVTTSLNRLEQKGYIIRKRSDVDRRVVHLSLSPKGRQSYPTIASNHHLLPRDSARNVLLLLFWQTPLFKVLQKLIEIF